MKKALFVLVSALAFNIIFSGTASAQRRHEGRRDNWVECANEKGICQIPGRGTLFYGTNVRMTDKEVYEAGAYTCRNEAFADGDPHRGVPKKCFYRLDQGYSPIRFCSIEDGICQIQSRRPVMVHYGVDGRTVRVRVYGDVKCSHKNLAVQDPAPGLKKSCYISQLH